MKIFDIDPHLLVPYENNTKIHPQQQIDNVAESIRRYGWKQPIVIDADNVVIIGHCRLLAALKLGLESVPVYKVEDLTEQEIRELRIADNKTAESEWDFEKLKQELADLKMEGFDLGFDDIKKEDQPKHAEKHEQKDIVCPRCGHVFEELSL